VENEFLVTVVPIMDHAGPLATAFPVENRLTGQTNDELRAVLSKAAAAPFAKRIADFHLLLYISPMLGEEDLQMLCEAVRTGGAVSDGHALLINAIAGIH
jgi:nuclear protein localization family protein 4